MSCNDNIVSESDLQGLIFDCDGTLIDTMPAYWESWKKTCQHFGIDFNQKRFYDMAGIPVNDIMRTLIADSGLSESVTVEEAVKYKKKVSAQSVEDVGTPAIDIVVDIAKRYRGKIPMAVASSGFRDHVVRSLKVNGIYDYFDAIVTAEDIQNPKPAPDIFIVAAKRINCNPKKCRGFEDADAGMQSLRAAGLEAIDVRLMKGYPAVIPSEESVLSSQCQQSKSAASVEEAHGKDGGVLGSLRLVAIIGIVIALCYRYGSKLLFNILLDERYEDD